MDIVSKFKGPKALIRKWNKQVFGNIDFNINKLEKVVADLESKIEAIGADEVNLVRSKALRSVLQNWYDRKDSYWRQLSRERYITGMDRNAKFFHRVATIRRRRKLMLEIRRGRRVFGDPRIIKVEVRQLF